MKKWVTLSFPKELWERFYAKYRKDSREKLREFVRKDLEES